MFRSRGTFDSMAPGLLLLKLLTQLTHLPPPPVQITGLRHTVVLTMKYTDFLYSTITSLCCTPETPITSFFPGLQVAIRRTSDWKGVSHVCAYVVLAVAQTSSERSKTSPRLHVESEKACDPYKVAQTYFSRSKPCPPPSIR